MNQRLLSLMIAGLALVGGWWLIVSPQRREDAKFFYQISAPLRLCGEAWS